MAIAHGTVWSSSPEMMSKGPGPHCRAVGRLQRVRQVGANFETHYSSSGVAAMVLLAVSLYLANGVPLAGYQSAVVFERTSPTPG